MNKMLFYNDDDVLDDCTILARSTIFGHAGRPLGSRIASSHRRSGPRQEVSGADARQLSWPPVVGPDLPVAIALLPGAALLASDPDRGFALKLSPPGLVSSCGGGLERALVPRA